jgi:hypothetical protein
VTGGAVASGDAHAAVRADRARTRALEASELAWLAAAPCALLIAAAIALLGPALGHALLHPGSEAFLPVRRRPEPAEHGRYLIALLAPVLLAGVVFAGVSRRLTLAPPTTRRLTLAAHGLLLAFVAFCFAAQNGILLNADRAEYIDPAGSYGGNARYFTWPTLVLALVLPALLLLLLARRHAVRERLSAALRETRARRVACLLLAALLTALWLSTAVNTDGSIAHADPAVAAHVPVSIGETFAVLVGRTPLVDFHPQYGQLWPYLAAVSMSLFGASLGVYTLVMTTASGLTLLAVYATLRRLVQRSVVALLLFLPVLATGFFKMLGPLANRYGPANLFSLWPVRYAGPYVLAWLLVRHLDGAAPRRRWLLLLIGGVAVLNNPEFGLPALGATLVALICVRPPRSARATGLLLVETVGGLLGAAALLSLLTLARAGSLPHFGLLLEFSRLFGIGGWMLLPLPHAGIFLVIYVTFVAAIAVAVVRALQRAQQPALTAMLAWSGTFGLLAGSYYVGRSHPQVLVGLFSPWALALALLAIVVVRDLAARGWRRPTVPELLVLAGLALAVCSLAQTPTPWSQVHRLSRTTRLAVFKEPAASRAIAAETRPGEPVVLLLPLGYRIAYDIGIDDVSPYTNAESLATRQQLDTIVAALRAAHGRKLFITTRYAFPLELEDLLREGLALRRHVPIPGEGELLELVVRSDGHAR